MKNRQKHINTFIRCSTVVLLLSIYISAILFDSFHSFFNHHDDHQHCSVEVEISPCHQKIYHNNVQQGCDHKAHLIPERHDCKLCDALFAKYKTTEKDIELTSTFTSPKHIPFFKESRITSYFYPSILLRGPPEVA